MRLVKKTLEIDYDGRVDVSADSQDVVSSVETDVDQGQLKRTHQSPALFQNYETYFVSIIELGELSSYREACRSVHANIR